MTTLTALLPLAAVVAYAVVVERRHRRQPAPSRCAQRCHVHVKPKPYDWSQDQPSRHLRLVVPRDVWDQVLDVDRGGAA